MPDLRIVSAVSRSRGTCTAQCSATYALDKVVRIAEEANRFGTFDAVIHNAGMLHGPDVLAVNVLAP